MMITVMELLSYPLFGNFKLLTDNGGLYNTVTGTGIFEWETKEDIEATFEAGEFVMTTLSCAKDDIHNADERLTALIQKGVAAIAVKNVYFSGLSEDLIALANRHSVPIFLFSDTYFDDIIYTIKNALISNDLNAILAKKTEALLDASGSQEEMEALAREINPFFYNDVICSFFTPVKTGSDASQILDSYFSYYRSLSQKSAAHSGVAYTLIRVYSGILLIFTADRPEEEIKSRLFSLLSYLELRDEELYTGVSSCGRELSCLPALIRESIYACYSCFILKKELLDFGDIGLCKILFPLRDNPWVDRMYKTFEDILIQYDEKHNSNLFQTLIEYVRNGGDIVATADKMYQHSNTIRYRLDKIKTILKIHDAPDAYSQLYIFARLYEIRQTLGDLRI